MLLEALERRVQEQKSLTSNRYRGRRSRIETRGTESIRSTRRRCAKGLRVWRSMKMPILAGSQSNTLKSSDEWSTEARIRSAHKIMRNVQWEGIFNSQIANVASLLFHQSKYVSMKYQTPTRNEPTDRHSNGRSRRIKISTGFSSCFTVLYPTSSSQFTFPKHMGDFESMTYHTCSL